jgi:4-diphosphocytidyl-2-C-methyl-D-erythritol kinase
MARTEFALTELARAKVNLTLRVLGRRADGFHELDSVVAFAGVGDVLTLEAAERFELVAPGLDVALSDNLISKAAQLFAAAYGPLNVRLTLNKHLPVAAGIGGGSADAAAALRLLARTLPPVADIADEIRRSAQLLEMAEPLGSDVTVCLANRLIHMRGRGHDLTALLPIRPLPAVLVNARAAVPANKTAAVFKALAAGPLRADQGYSVEAGAASTAEGLQRLIAEGHNDLQAVACQIMPEVEDVLAALSAQPGNVVTRMSGAGPTCFGLFETTEAAAAATQRMQAAQPGWWVVATTLS